MKNQRKYQKGITLIALVITIIVLLILAGVTLSIVFNGGIIDKSQNAVDKYSQAQQNETEILDYLNKQFSLHITALDNINGNENKKIIEQTDKIKKYCNPVVPVGFKTVNTETASWEVVEDEKLGTIVKGWNDGLVIEDKDGNQFVWVPVDRTNVSYEKWYSEKTNSTIKTNVQNASNLGEDELPSGVTSEDAQITEYGGFYIARYEAGIPESMTNAINIDSTLSGDALKAELKRVRNVEVTTGVIPVSKKGQIPWNYIDYTTSKANAQSMYSSNYVKSGLVTGRQWDATMKWLENANPSVDVQRDSTGWGNYKDAQVSGITLHSTNWGASWTQIDSTTKGTSTSWLLKTGHTDYTSRKNIYDLAGNVWEWTNEKYSTDRVLRGGGCSSSGMDVTAAYRSYKSVDGTSNYLGFRCVLYVM